MNGHILHYKNDKGEWITLPVSVISVYDEYVSYCTAQGIAPVDKETYYKALADVDTKLHNLDIMLGDLRNIENLQSAIDAIKGNMIPTTMGGTGTAFDDFSDLAVGIGEVITDEVFTENRRVPTVSTTKALIEDTVTNPSTMTKLIGAQNPMGVLCNNNVCVNNRAPDASVPASIKFYFQY